MIIMNYMACDRIEGSRDVFLSCFLFLIFSILVHYKWSQSSSPAPTSTSAVISQHSRGGHFLLKQFVNIMSL